MLKLIRSMGELNIEQFLAVYRQSIGQDPQKEQDLLSYLREDFFRQPGAFYGVWETQNTYQCALRLEPYRDGLLVESLETAPNARRRGYAYALLIQVLAYLHTIDCTGVYSHISKRNKASIALHTKCGFRQISDSAHLVDGTVTQSSCTMYIDL